MHLEAVSRRRIAVGKMLVDQKKRQWIVAVKTVAESAAPLVEVRQQPAFFVKILKIVRWGFAGLVILRRARRDALTHQLIDSIN